MLAFSVGFTISVERDNSELMMLNIMFIAIIENRRHVNWSVLSILLNLC